jgi:hypothetical protein
MAADSGRQNRYILVFTIATVFYLPISFIMVSYFSSDFHLFSSHAILIY